MSSEKRKNITCPLVSVVICEHNTPQVFFEEAIRSVLEQTYKNFEIIVIDDCSDSSNCTLPILSDQRIRIYKNNTNLGLAASRNKGISLSGGKYIAIMDTDDICSPDRLERQVDYMEKHLNVVCSGSYVRLFGQRNCKQRYQIRNTDYYRCCLLFGNSPTLTNPSVMIRRELFSNGVVVYDESLKTAEDYDMWTQLSKCGDIRIIKKVLLKYRIREGQMSQVFRSDKMNEYNWKITKKQLLSLGYKNIERDEDLIRCRFTDRCIEPFKYLVFLKELIDANSKSKYFNEKQLVKRCKFQWKQKVYSITSLSDFKGLLKQLDSREKIQVIMWCILRPFNLFYKIKELFNRI